MLKTSVVRTLFFSAVAVLVCLFAAKPMHAQIGQGNLTWNINSYTVYNGGPNNTGTVNNPNTIHLNSAPSVSLSLGMGINGINGQGGSASYTCYITDPNGNTLVPVPFQGTTYSNVVVNNQSPSTPPTIISTLGTYNSYCTATYTGGRYASGTISTAIITFTLTT